MKKSNKTIEDVLLFFQSYSVEISRYILEFNPDNHVFICDIDKNPGALNIIIQEDGEDGAIFTREYNLWEDAKEALPKSLRKESIQYLYCKAIVDEQINEEVSKKKFVALN